MKNSVKVIIFLLTILVYTNFTADKYPAFIYAGGTGIPVHSRIIMGRFMEGVFESVYNLYYHEYNAQFVGANYQQR